MNKILEQKRKRIEWAVKLLALGAIAFVVQPVIVATIQGLLGMLAAILIGALAINFAPWVGMKLANWKLKALKAEAEENPIETLENEYKERESALTEFKSNIEALHAETKNVYDQIKAHREQFPDSESEFEPMYQAMVAALNDRVNKYKMVQASLQKFSKVIEQKRSEFRVAQALAKARKAANVGADFMSKLMEDTALNSVKNQLNLEFAALQTSILDNTAPTERVVVNAAPTAALPQHAGPPTLDLDFVIESEPVAVARK